MYNKNVHLSCLRLEVQPKGKWFCRYCARKKTRGKESK